MTEIREYRGHIRNWKELCAELSIDASLDRESRELAIISAAYEKWGRDMGEHLYGMFAFCLWDGEKIFAMRDHFGTKPFFYYVTDEGKIKVIPDVRGINVCPLVSHLSEIRFDRGFLFRVKKVGRLLYTDKECRKFLEDTSREIDLILSLME